MKTRTKEYQLTDEIVTKYYKFLVEIFDGLNTKHFKRISINAIGEKYKVHQATSGIIKNMGWVETNGIANRACKYRLATDKYPTRHWAITILKEIQKLNKKYYKPKGVKAQETIKEHPVKTQIVNNTEFTTAITKIQADVAEIKTLLNGKSKTNFFQRFVDAKRKQRTDSIQRRKKQRIEDLKAELKRLQ